MRSRLSILSCLDFRGGDLVNANTEYSRDKIFVEGGTRRFLALRIEIETSRDIEAGFDPPSLLSDKLFVVDEAIICTRFLQIITECFNYLLYLYVYIHRYMLG